MGIGAATNERTAGMVISIGSDHGGVSLKSDIKAFLRKEGYSVKDFGTNTPEPCDYPDYALKVAESVAGGGSKLGILICKSGIGMAIAANKVPGIRAALCHDEDSARLSREHNDANILALDGSLKKHDALKIVRAWLESGFGGGEDSTRHKIRLDKIRAIEDRYSKKQPNSAP